MQYRPARFAKVCERDGAEVAGLLLDCLVVTAAGEQIGRVDQLIVDVITRQPRYAIVKRRNCATVAIPWHALYLDVLNGRLVFYTWPQESQEVRMFNKGF